MKIGVIVLGLASIAAGVLDLIWGEFESAHQPVQAFGDHIPGVTFFAYLTAVWLIAGGAAILIERTARIGAVMLAVIYTVFAIFWLPRFYTAPHYLGYRLSVYIGVLGGPGGQLIVTIGALLVYAKLSARALSPRQATVARWVFGLFVADFGIVHLLDIAEPAEHGARVDAAGRSFLGGGQRYRLYPRRPRDRLGNSRRAGCAAARLDVSALQHSGADAERHRFSARTHDVGRRRL